MRTTVCLLNYRRPHNVNRILSALAQQVPAVEVFLWNNGAPQDFAADWLVQSSRNLYCPPRWWLAIHATTEAVVILDDDLLPTSPSAIAALVAVCDPTRIVGPFGAVLGRRYRDRRDVNLPPTDTPVDLVKGRCMAMQITSLRQVIQSSGVLTADPGAACEIAEDIAICGAMAHGSRLHHLVPGGLAGSWANLFEGAEALSRRPDHDARRTREAARWFQ